jgi:DNA-binding beta-propeller fold protein YncE
MNRKIRLSLARRAAGTAAVLALFGAAAGCTSSGSPHSAAGAQTTPSSAAGSGTAPVPITSFKSDPSLAVRTIHTGTGSAPSGIAVTRNAVWVTEHRGHQIVRIDPATGRIVAHIPVSVGEGGIEDAVEATGRYVYLCVYGENRLLRIDARTNRIDARLHVPCEGKGSGPLGVWITGGDALRLVDPHRLRIARTFHLPGVPADDASDISEAGGSVWVGYSTGLLVRVAPDSGRILAKWNFGAVGLLTTDGKYVYLSNGADNSVQVVDVATNHVVRHGQYPGIDEGDPIVTYGAGALWLATLNGGLARVDPATMQITGSVQLDSQDYVGEIGVGYGHVWYPTYGDDSVVELSTSVLAH